MNNKHSNFRYLLLPDPTDGGIVQDIDPLNVNVNDVDTSRPRLVPGLYTMKIATCVAEPNKAGDGQNLVIGLLTTQEAQSNDGNQIAAGFKLTNYISLTPRASEGKKAYTIEDVKKSVSSVAQSAGLDATVRAIINDPNILVGRQVIVDVKVAKANAEYPESNSISGFKTERK